MVDLSALPPQGSRANSATRAKRKYNSRMYKAFTFNLKIDGDAEIIKEFEEARAQGVSAADVVRRLYKEAAAAR